MTLTRRLALLLLPYFRREFPGWGKLARLAGITSDEVWKGAPPRTLTGKLHGYRMRADVANWSERWTYFLGRFYELDTQAFLAACLRPGDVFADVGANIGMLTLLAARLVGGSGAVLAFEPNPSAFARLREHVEMNGLGQVQLHNHALADRDDELVLQVVSSHTGLGTFGSVAAEDEAAITARHRCRIERGDARLDRELCGPLTVKIDVEGFECHVLRGLSSTLERHRPAVVTEKDGRMLEKAGSSVTEMTALLHSRGYRCLAIEMRRSVAGRRLVLRPIAGLPGEEYANVAWVHPEGVHWARLARYLSL
jgi:FkbM family methyltransferase